jgi:hypothetical protein
VVVVAAVGQAVAEKTLTSEIRPTYGSVVVLTTSAHSRPAGSQVSGSTGTPSGRVTGSSGCSSGDGNAAVSTSSSSVIPTPVPAQTGSTG